MKKKTLMWLCLAIATSTTAFAQKTIELVSPNKAIKTTIHVNKNGVTYDIAYNNAPVLTDNTLGMQINGKELTATPRLGGVKKTSKHQVVEPAIPIKFSHIEADYNEVTLPFAGNWSLVWRSYNDGVAYRFVTKQKGMVEVTNETFELRVPADYMLHIQPDPRFTSAYENFYAHMKSGEWTKEGDMSNIPVLIDAGSCQVLYSEADLYDYPRMFMKHTDKGLAGAQPKVWLDSIQVGDRHTKATKEAEYIARTNGTRNFPWRYFVIGDSKTLVENTMNARLSSDVCMLDDTSWIKPGKVAWDWWNGLAVYGPDVNFKYGVNTETYKYYIDFASKYGIEYIIMDEGWSVSVNEPYKIVDSLDMAEVIRYGKEKNVGVVLWCTWLMVDRHPEIFKTFADWGVVGMKIDFMEQTDQGMVNYYERTVKEAAKHHLLVDFHGAFTPAGLEYRYPNLLSYEGVRGMENMGSCLPSNSLYFPFMRNAVGAMDYTPGAMLSTQPERYGTDRPNSMSVGTRAYQLALFIAFESGIQMLGDSPTQYYRNPDCTEFMAGVPVTWDETIALEAKTGEYLVVAKRKGEKWYLAGITAEKEQEFTINLDFIKGRKTYQMTAFTDGINADRQAMDYRCNKSMVSSTSQVKISMVRNGGFAAVIE